MNYKSAFVTNDNCYLSGFLTCGVGGIETLPLHRGIRDKAQVDVVACGDKGLRGLAAAQSTEDGRPIRVAVENLQVIVCTLLVLLDLKLAKQLRNMGDGDGGSDSVQCAISFQLIIIIITWILTILTRCPGVAVMSHVHSFLLGYLSGQLGLLRVPLGAWLLCSHSATETHERYYFKEKY